MKKNLLIITGLVFIAQGLLAQDINYLKNGDFDEQGVWEIVASDGNAADMEWSFGEFDGVPEAGEGTCLKASWSNVSTPLNQIMLQKVYLTIGDSYTFSGAFNDVGTSTDVNQAWWQIIIWPTIIDDNDPSDGIQGIIPEDEDCTIMLNHAIGWTYDHFGIGLNSTFEEDQTFFYGDQIGCGEFGDQGDTTVYTVPETMVGSTENFPLGSIGDTVEYYVALSMGQWIGDEAWSNTVAFTFDEFKLMGPKHGDGAVAAVKANDVSKLRTYPNPVRDLLTVECESMISALKVNNILGQEVLKMNNINSKQARLNTSELSNSIYVLTITDESGKEYTSKILKK